MIVKSVVFAFGILIASYSTVPRVIWGDTKLFFPFNVLMCVVLSVAVLLILLFFVRGGSGIAGRRIVILFVSSFLISDLAIGVLGFDWTGDWVRFVLFRCGLRSEQEAQVEDFPGSKTYYWREDGYSSIRLYYYLMYDSTDNIASIPTGIKSAMARCPFVANRFMAVHWYLLETYNCVLDKGIPSDSVWKKRRE